MKIMERLGHRGMKAIILEKKQNKRLLDIKQTKELVLPKDILAPRQEPVWAFKLFQKSNIKKKDQALLGLFSP